MTFAQNLSTTLLWPLQGMVNFFSPPAQRTGTQPTASQRAAALHDVRTNLPYRSGAQSARSVPHTPSLADSLHNAAPTVRTCRTSDGRIRMSGRMRDVCAELDRLCAAA